eukprot:288746-Hanusia_phi.AAC.1
MMMRRRRRRRRRERRRMEMTAVEGPLEAQRRGTKGSQSGVFVDGEGWSQLVHRVVLPAA